MKNLFITDDKKSNRLIFHSSLSHHTIKYLTLFSLILSLILSFIFSLIDLQLHAATPVQIDQKQEHKNSIVFNPLGTIVGVVASALTFPTISLNGRYQYAYNDRWALNIAPQFVYTDIVTFENYLLGIKVGPRYSISQRYLNGWYVSPMGLAGFLFSKQFGEHVQSAFMIGVGAEFGYAWHWTDFALELGGGFHYSGLVGHTSKLRGETGKTPPFSFGPILNVSLGYGW